MAPTSGPTLPSVPPPAGAAEVAGLPFAGQAPVTGSAQAVAIAPTLGAAANAADTGAPGDTQNLFLLFTVVIMAIPALLTMTLLATVLTRR